MSDEDDWFEFALHREGDGEEDDRTRDENHGRSDTDSQETSDSSADDGDSLFEVDFEAAFENAPGAEIEGESGSSGAFEGGAFDSGSFGGGGFDSGGFDSGGFDDEEFESAIPRIDIGIEGLDSMIQGGVPER